MIRKELQAAGGCPALTVAANLQGGRSLPPRSYEGKSRGFNASPTGSSLDPCAVSRWTSIPQRLCRISSTKRPGRKMRLERFMQQEACMYQSQSLRFLTHTLTHPAPWHGPGHALLHPSPLSCGSSILGIFTHGRDPTCRYGLRATLVHQARTHIAIITQEGGKQEGMREAKGGWKHKLPKRCYCTSALQYFATNEGCISAQVVPYWTSRCQRHGRSG